MVFNSLLFIWGTFKKRRALLLRGTSYERGEGEARGIGRAA
jgi:hypothetical protein